MGLVEEELLKKNRDMEKSESKFSIDEYELEEGWSPQEWQLIKKMYEIKQNTELLNSGIGEQDEEQEPDTRSYNSEEEVISID